MKEIESIINIKTTLSYEKAFLYFLQLLKDNFCFPTPVRKENNGTAVPIYRSRIIEGNCNNLNIKEIKHRCANEVSTFGRINRPNQAYFYACDDYENCLKELDKEIKFKKECKKEFVVITGQWTLKKDLIVCIIPDWNNPRMLPFINKVESLKNISEENLEILKYINTLFLKEDNNSNIHRVTSAFCNAILFNAINQNINFDGFLYTCVKDGTGYNLALFPHVIDNGDIILTSVVKNYIETKQIDLKSGKIIWQ